LVTEKPTITSNNNELIVIRKLVHSDIRESRDNLLLWRQVCTFLELEVANSSGKSKIAVDTAEIYKTTSCSDTGLFS